MIFIETPDKYIPEREYAIDFVFRDVLGVTYTITPRSAIEQIRMILPNGKIVTAAEELFQTPDQEWLTEASIPGTPIPKGALRSVREINATTSVRLPLLFHDATMENDEPCVWSKTNEKTSHIHFDIFGAIFFMLTRYEEVVVNAQDIHGRFDCSKSIAVRNGFSERPLVDEYVELLWKLIQYQDATVECKTRVYKVHISHDLDRPFRFNGVGGFLRGLMGHLLKRRSLRMAYEWLYQGATRMWAPENDPFLVGLRQLLDISDEYGQKSQINVMGAVPGTRDNGYDVNREPLRSTLLDALYRGHVLGFHPGYATAEDPQRFREEKARVDGALSLRSEFSRQHFLKMKIPGTWRIWEEQGIVNDCSLGYPDRIGFRAGTCRPFTLFDVEKRRVLNVQETPLIVMDGALKASFNEGLSPEEAIEKAVGLARVCKQYGGTFSILWHNSSLHGDWTGWGHAYKSIIKDATALADA